MVHMRPQHTYTYDDSYDADSHKDKDKDNDDDDSDDDDDGDGGDDDGGVDGGDAKSPNALARVHGPPWPQARICRTLGVFSKRTVCSEHELHAFWADPPGSPRIPLGESPPRAGSPSML